MRRTRACAVLLTVLTLLVRPASATASTVTLTDWTTGDFATNAPGGGGPFTASTDTLGDFVTFCLEFNEHFGYGGTYTFTLSDGAVNGGVSGQTGANFDPVSDATKWVYAQVRTGGYTAFSPFGTGDGVGILVQQAIWFLEGERSLADIGGAAGASYGLAAFAQAQDWNALYLAGNRVYAMNLLTTTGGLAQDQLAWEFEPPITPLDTTPVPEPGSLLLLGSALVGLARRRARR